MNRESDFEIVTRQDAAKRQITTAIELVFGRGDAVSANVLTWSASEMLRGVASAKGIQTFHTNIEMRVREEYIKEWRNILKSNYNYFKHADRDPERVIEDFSPEATTWALFAAGVDYYSIYGKRTWAMLVYHVWFLCRHPNITYEDARELVDKISPSLDYPQGQPLNQAVSAGMQMLESGRKYPEVVAALGDAWLARIEAE